MLIDKSGSKGLLRSPDTLNFAHFFSLAVWCKNGNRFLEPLDDILLEYKTYCVEICDLQEFHLHDSPETVPLMMIPNGLFCLFIYLLNNSKFNWKDNLIWKLQSIILFLGMACVEQRVVHILFEAVNFILPEYTSGICKETTIQGPSYQVSARGKQPDKNPRLFKNNFFLPSSQPKWIVSMNLMSRHCTIS